MFSFFKFIYLFFVFGFFSFSTWICLYFQDKYNMANYIEKQIYFFKQHNLAILWHHEIKSVLYINIFKILFVYLEFHASSFFKILVKVWAVYRDWCEHNNSAY